MAEASPPTTDPKRRGRASILARMTLSAGVFVLAFVIGEAFLRAAMHRANSSVLAAASEQVEAPSENPEARLINIIRLCDNDRIIYELQPDMKGRNFRRTKVTTDEQGFRVGPQVPDDSRPLVTIMGIGDSIMFGHGVEDDQAYLYVLQNLLQEKYPSRRWRVINTGVPGYNTAMEVETLRSKGLLFEPDIVILNIVGNDYAPPYFVRNEEDVWALRSFVVDYIAERVAASPEELRASSGTAVQRGGTLYDRGVGDQPLIPERYKDLFGEQAYAQALDDLKLLSEEHGFGVLAFTTYEYDLTFEMVEQAKARGFVHSTLMPELKSWMLKHAGEEWTPESYSNSQLVVSPKNTHPSAKQNRMAARRLMADMKKFGLLKKVLGKQ